MAPRPEAIVPLQQGWQWLATAAATAALVRLLVEQMVTGDGSHVRAISKLQEERWRNPERRDEFWRNIPELPRIVLRSVVITVVLAGIYQQWMDALLVAIVVIFFEIWRAGLVARLPEWWKRAVFKMPPLFRFVIALVLGYLLSHWIITRQWRGDTFRPVLWASISTLLLFYFLFPREDVKETTIERREAQ
jgi:hypothetical protein